MSTTPEATEPSLLCEEARGLAERGELDGAARIFERVLALGDVPERAQAALGLAVVLGDGGDTAGAREAGRVAIATGHAEYAPRAAYHLALTCEREGEREDARRAWELVAGFGNPAYLPPACMALARLADEDGDHEAACAWWERTIATGDGRYAPVAAHDLAHRLMERGEPARAQRVLAETLRGVDREREPYVYARLALTIGMAYLDQAIGAFGAALADAGGDRELAPLAIELLARTLPLRGRDDEAREAWERGVGDPGLGDQVRARLRREFAGPPSPVGVAGPGHLDPRDHLDHSGHLDHLDDPAGGDEATGAGDPAGAGDVAGPEGGAQPWWEPYLESAARSGTMPALAGEAFGALDLMYTTAALRYAEGGPGLGDEAYALLGQVVDVPSGYDWGRGLHDSFAERLRLAVGSMEPVLPPGWPAG